MSKSSSSCFCAEFGCPHWHIESKVTPELLPLCKKCLSFPYSKSFAYIPFFRSRHFYFLRDCIDCSCFYLECKRDVTYIRLRFFTRVLAVAESLILVVVDRMQRRPTHFLRDCIDCSCLYLECKRDVIYIRVSEFPYPPPAACGSLTKRAIDPICGPIRWVNTRFVWLPGYLVTDCDRLPSHPVALRIFHTNLKYTNRDILARHYWRNPAVYYGWE